VIARFIVFVLPPWAGKMLNKFLDWFIYIIISKEMKKNSLKRKILYIGPFAKKSIIAIGGTVKTNEIYNALLFNVTTRRRLRYLDVFQWRRHKILIFFRLLLGVLFYKNFILVISYSALKKLFNLPMLFSKNILFIPIGNICCNDLTNKEIQKINNCINVLFVQTESLKADLICNNIKSKIIVMHNFKIYSNFVFHHEYFPLNANLFRFCFLSRVTETKGIFDAIEIVEKYNYKNDLNKIELDIFGIIDPIYSNEFNILLETKDFIRYCGIIPYKDVPKVITKYFMLLFPTKFDGEGFPGAILDSLAAGLPVLSSNFKYYQDILIDNYTGLSFKINDFDEFYSKICYAVENYHLINTYRENCLQQYRKYSFEKEIVKLQDEIMLI
jgi:glycosyltransferase involved in cell wall biosynthesis